MSVKNKIYLPLIIVCSIIVGLFLGDYVNFGGDHSLDFQHDTHTSRFDILNHFIENDYVDSVDLYQLEETAIISMLDSLDPHSTYLGADDLRASNEIMKGNFEGIGVQFRIEDDTIYIAGVIQGGPSEKVGIRTGDRIVKVNDSIVAGIGIENSDVQKLLKGPKGSVVKVGIVRRNVSDILSFNIVRNVIPNTSVDIAYMVEPTIGYIKVSTFSMTTGKEFRNALKKLKNLGMRSLILDLRDNGGGLLRAAVEMCSEFLEKGSLVVFTEGLNSPRSDVKAYLNGNFLDGDLVVLVNESSASASEIVAGAVQDHDRGVIIGRTTFGKGLVQEQLNLDDSSAVRLTVARYHTPSGRCIQRPYEGGRNKYYEDYYERYVSGELMYEDSIRIVDTTQKFYTASNRVVYGGGGINPDIFVPLESVKDNNFYYQLLNKSVLFAYSFDYTDARRDDLLGKYPDSQSFIDNFTVSEKMMGDIISEAKDNNIVVDNDQYLEAKNDIKILVKSYIGRNLYDYEAFYPVYHKIDDEVQKAVEVLTDQQNLSTFMSISE